MVESKQVQEWMAQGETRGELRDKIDFLLSILAERFGPVSNDPSEAIRATQDVHRLKVWLAPALKAADAEVFAKQAGI